MPNIEQVRKNLEARGYQTSYFETVEECYKYMNQAVDGQTVGFGGSQTVREMGLFEQLNGHNNCVWHSDKKRGVVFKEATDAQVYICSLNGVSETGELVNIDGGGNRAASGLFGHEKVYFIVGTNKIAPDLNSAIWRARNIAAPKNAQRLDHKTPCALHAEKCYDCKSPDRICAAMIIYWQKPSMIPEVEIVIVDQNLGF